MARAGLIDVAWPRVARVLRRPKVLLHGDVRDVAAHLRGIARPLRIPEPERSLIYRNPRTLGRYLELLSLYDAAQTLDRRRVPGAFVEFGVGPGGSLALLAQMARRSPFRRLVWGFDSFAGLPPPSEPDRLPDDDASPREGDLAFELAGVRAFLFQELNLPETQVRLVKGFFADTISQYEGGPIALLNLDVDLYGSYRTCLQLLDRVTPRGIVFVDEYYSPRWPGCRAAVDEVLRECRAPVEVRKVAGGFGRGFFEWPGTSGADPAVGSERKSS